MRVGAAFARGPFPPNSPEDNMFTNRCATLLLLGGLTAACADTTSVTAPMDASPPGPSFSIIAVPDAGYLAQTTKIDISGLVNGQSVTSITDGTQTVAFDLSFSKSTFSQWGTPPAVETSGVNFLGSESDATVVALTLSRATTIFGFEAYLSGLTNDPITAEFYSPSGALLETITQSHTGGKLYAASSVGLISRVLIYPAGAGGLSIAQVRYGEVLDLSATMDGSVTVNPKTGVAVVSGTIECTIPATVPITVSLQQDQKAKRVPVVVQASSSVSVPCAGSQGWSIALTPSSGGFVNGAASSTLNAGAGLVDPPVAVAKGVTLFWGHK